MDSGDFDCRCFAGGLLVQIKSRGTDFDPYNYRGHYYYDKYQEPIAFYGEMDSVGNIILHEANLQQKDIVFVGKMDANGEKSYSNMSLESLRSI